MLRSQMQMVPGHRRAAVVRPMVTIKEPRLILLADRWLSFGAALEVHFTHAAVDGPDCDYSPAMRKCGQKVGSDSYASPFSSRYQTGFMLANGAATAVSGTWATK